MNELEEEVNELRQRVERLEEALRSVLDWEVWEGTGHKHNLRENQKYHLWGTHRTREILGN